jgi:predicted DCC family thiol-disulfide oxidoreductase YuxK
MSGRLQRAYLEADPRSLAAGRVALALVLLLDLARRAVEIDVWYTNEGLLPNHTVLWRPTFTHVFSFFFMASTELAAALGFLLCAVAYLALLFGWHTRLAQLASFLCVLSLHARTIFIQNGGDVVLSELALWTLFLPTGTRWSLDSLLASLRARAEKTAADLVPRDVPANEPIVSRAVLALRLQLVVIYFFNAIQKTGPDWREGSVVHWVLHQDRIVTTLGLWVRGWIEPWQSAALTWPSLAIEAALPLLLLTPLAAVVFAAALHVGFGLFLNLGVFVPAMLAYLPNLLSRADWDALARRFSATRRRLVLFDASCGFCFQTIRVLARLDPGGRLELIGNDQRERMPKGVDEALTEETLVVVDPESGAISTGARAFAEIFRCLPFGRPIAWLLVGTRPIADVSTRSAMPRSFCCSSSRPRSSPWRTRPCRRRSGSANRAG